MRLKLRNRKNKNRTIFSILFVALVFMGIGYAYIQSQIIIGGSANAKKQKWNIEMKNITVDPKSTATLDSINKTNNKLDVHFKVNLKSLDDYYAFYFDIENNGTMDAKLNNITLSGLTDAEKALIDYSFNYYVKKDTVNLNDKLPQNEMETILVTIRFKQDSATTSGNYNLSLKLDYTPSKEGNSRNNTLLATIRNNAIPDNIISQYVKGDTGINYKTQSSETNGQGIYSYTPTINDQFPVYIYRGNVTNNYVKFANYCWQILRTTDTGGVKIIYNGELNEDGTCTDHNTANNIIEAGWYANNTKSISDAGYRTSEVRYPARSEKTIESLTGTIVYGNDVDYDSASNTYTLKSTIESTDYATDLKSIQQNHHYTCFSDSSTCNEVYYLIYATATKLFYYNFSNGKKIDNIISDMLPDSNERNEVDNKMKKTIDKWYLDHLVDFTDKIEDTIYPNCRTPLLLNSLNKDNSNASAVEYADRATQVSFKCEDKWDNFTVNESDSGNGALTYPIGTLTRGEAIAAGMIGNTSTETFLKSSYQYWTMSPSIYVASNVDATYINEGMLKDDWVWRADTGYRPVISLKRGIKYISGSGLANDPYEIEQ